MQEFSNPQIRFLEKSAEVMTQLYRDPSSHRSSNHLAVSFPEFVKAPIQTIEDIHNFFGLSELTPSDKRNLHGFLTQKESQKTTRPKFTLEELGLEAGDLKRRFSQYEEVFGHLYKG